MDRESPQSRRGGFPIVVETLGVVSLLTVYVALAAWNACTTSPTSDEPVHLAAGYTYLAAGDYRLNPEHPPLVKVLAAIPMYLGGAFTTDDETNAPQSRSERASLSNAALRADWLGIAAHGRYWYFVHELFYGFEDEALLKTGARRAAEMPTDRRGPFSLIHGTHGLFVRARLVILFFGVLLGLLIWSWTRELFGVVPAMMALAVFSFDPNFIGNGPLVATDVPASAGVFSAVYFLWRALRIGGWRNETATAISVAVSAVVKYSTIILAPMFLVVMVAWIVAPRFIGEPSSPARGRMRRAVRILLVSCTAAYAAIWASYGFRFDALADQPTAARLESAHAPHIRAVPGREPGRLPVDWTFRQAAANRALLARGIDDPSPEEIDAFARSVELPITSRGLMWLHDREALPEAYVMGLAHLRFSLLRSSFLDGRIAKGGFRDYFIRTFLYKTSLPLLVLVVLAVAVVSTRREARDAIIPLLAPVAIYLVAVMASTLNIGHRHLLPIYPFLMVMLGALAARWMDAGYVTGLRKVGAAVIVVALSAFIVFVPITGSVVVPHHLSYFNELAGGPTGGAVHLVDSNLDWGQDLPALRTWLDEHAPNEMLHFCYFGTADPRAYGIAFVNMPGGFGEAPMADFDPRTWKGLLAISATERSGVLWDSDLRAVWDEAFTDAELVGRAGYSIQIYRR